jgi:hypothetical protein
MTVRVAYYAGPDVSVWAGDPRDAPRDGVLWIEVRHPALPYRHRLQGRDRMWLAGNTFGTFNDPENLAWYGGDPAAQAGAWRWTETGSEQLSDASVPDGAIVFTGVLAPDDVYDHARSLP